VRDEAQDDPYQVLLLIEISSRLFTDYQASGDLAKLDEAIEARRQALALMPPDSPRDVRATWLTMLGRWLHERFKYTRNPTDLDAAIEYVIEALSLIPRSSRVRVEVHSGGSVKWYKLYFDWTNTAIEHGDEVPFLPQREGPELAVRLEILSNALLTRYESRFNRTD
jgi:hypothetical protein